jgi:hypothetical protein
MDGRTAVQCEDESCPRAVASCLSVVNVQIDPLAAQFNFNLLSSVFPLSLSLSLF